MCNWDGLACFEGNPVRSGKGWVCSDCRDYQAGLVSDDPEFKKLTVYQDRHDCWSRHMFEMFLQWVNENLASSKWLELYRNPKEATWAVLVKGGGLNMVDITEDADDIRKLNPNLARRVLIAT